MSGKPDCTNATHAAQVVDIANVAAGLVRAMPNLAEVVLVVHLDCGYRATIAFAKDPAASPVALIESALEAAREPAAPPKGATVQ